MDGRHPLRRWAAAVMAAVPLAMLPAAAGATTHDHHMVKVIVRSSPNHLDEARSLVLSFGGKVTLDLRIISGFAANVPADTVSTLQASPDVDSVSANAAVHMNTTLP